MIRVSKQAAEIVAAKRPEGYIEKLRTYAVREDAEYFYFTVKLYGQLYREYRGKDYQPRYLKGLERHTRKVPRLVKWITRFRNPEDRGVGDTVERMLAAAAGRHFKHLMHLLHLPCGCDDRQRWLNERFPYFH